MSRTIPVPLDVTPLFELAELFLGRRPEIGTSHGRREFFRACSDLFALLAGDLFDEQLTTREIAELTGRDQETCRLWCANKHLGHFDTKSGRYLTQLSDLITFWLNNFGADTMPAALRKRMVNYLAAPKRPSVVGPEHAAGSRQAPPAA